MDIVRPAPHPHRVAKKVKGGDSLWQALLLNLLLPGLGHILWREYLFGAFVFLVCLLAVLIAVVSLFLPLSALVVGVLLGLPIVFYIFTFFDLARSVRRRRPQVSVTRRRANICLLIGIAYQVFSPSAPGNFALRNRPEFFRVSDNSLSPVLTKGDLAKASRLDYTVNVAFVGQPIFHHLPSRFDLVRYTDAKGDQQTGLVVGLPNEEIGIDQGHLYSNRTPLFGDQPPVPISGDWPLTYAGRMSILIAVVYLGTVQDLRAIPLKNVTGKVSKVL